MAATCQAVPRGVRCDRAPALAGRLRNDGENAVSVFLLDTDHVTLYQLGHPQVLLNITRHLTDTLAISVITIEEQLAGWQRSLNQAKNDARREQVYNRMALTVESLADWRVVSFSLAAMARYAGLVR